MSDQYGTWKTISYSNRTPELYELLSAPTSSLRLAANLVDLSH